jgi:hypothetical protein
MLRIPLVPMLLVAVAVVGCRKDPVALGGIFPRMAHIELAVDSACVQAPNVFTPDGDGVNDVFVVYARNIVEIEVRILDADGEALLVYTDPLTGWNGSAPSGNGPYTVQVQAMTTSGVTLTGQAPLTILSYGNDNCLSHLGTPVCGDQLDPRLCGPVYATHDVFCP